MEKWEYITAISAASDKFGDLLLELMEENQASNLQQITEQQARKFYEERIKKHEQMAWHRPTYKGSRG